MPRGDGTGPMGMGPLTGRAACFCAGYPAPGSMNPVGGRGVGFWGRGRGGGRGWRNRYYAARWPGWARAGVGYPAWGGAVAPLAGPMTPAPQQELDALRGQAEYFETALGEIKERIDQLEAQAKE